MSRKKPIKIKVNDLKVDPEYIFLAKAVPSGNGAAIPFYKKFIGEEVYIILKKKCQK